MNKLIAALAFIVAFTAQTAMAQVPGTLGYQGFLEDNGTPVNAQKDLTFKIYDTESGGALIWQNALSGVAVEKGVFSVTLTGGNPDLGSVAFDKPYWISVTVDGTELSRVPLTATPYALRAKIANNISGGQAVTSLNGLTDAVKIEAGSNITVEQSGNSVKISAAGGVGGGSGGGLSGSGQENTLTKWGSNNALTESGITETGSGNSREVKIIGKLGIHTTNGSRDAAFQIGNLSNSSQTGLVVTGDRRLGIRTSSINSNVVFQIGNGNTGLFFTDDGRLGLRGVPDDRNAVFQVGELRINRDGEIHIGGDFSSSPQININKKGEISLVGGGISTTPLEIEKRRLRVANGSFQLFNSRFDIGGNSEIKASSWIIKENGDAAFGKSSTQSGFKLYVNGKAGGTVQWSTSSDRRFKTNIHTIDHALGKVRALRGVSFERTDRNIGEQIGFVAQEVEKILPQVVDTDEEGYKSIKYAAMVSVLVEAIKEMDSEIEQLKTQISELKAQQ